MVVEAELIAEKTPDDARRQRGGEIRVDVRKLDMPDHDRVQLRHQRGVGNHVLAQEFLDADWRRRKIVVRIRSCPTTGGEMFRAACDRALSQPPIPHPGMVDHALRIAAPAPPAQGVLGVREMVEVEDRREVQVET